MYTVLADTMIFLQGFYLFLLVEVVWRERNFWRWDCITLPSKEKGQAQESSLVGQEGH